MAGLQGAGGFVGGGTPSRRGLCCCEVLGRAEMLLGGNPGGFAGCWGWGRCVLGGGDDRQTLARVCRGLSVGRRLCWAPSTQPGLVPISPSEGTQWGHDGDRRSCHGFWPPITRTRGQEGEGVPPAGVPRSGGDAEGPPRPRASFGKTQPHGSRVMQEDAAGSGAAPMGSALW